jgi:hypothetical protein
MAAGGFLALAGIAVVVLLFMKRWLQENPWSLGILSVVPAAVFIALFFLAKRMSRNVALLGWTIFAAALTTEILVLGAGIDLIAMDVLGQDWSLHEPESYYWWKVELFFLGLPSQLWKVAIVLGLSHLGLAFFGILGGKSLRQPTIMVPMTFIFIGIACLPVLVFGKLGEEYWFPTAVALIAALFATRSLISSQESVCSNGPATILHMYAKIAVVVTFFPVFIPVLAIVAALRIMHGPEKAA